MFASLFSLLTSGVRALLCVCLLSLEEPASFPPYPGSPFQSVCMPQATSLVFTRLVLANVDPIVLTHGLLDLARVVAVVVVVCRPQSSGCARRSCSLLLAATTRSKMYFLDNFVATGSATPRDLPAMMQILDSLDKIKREAKAEGTCVRPDSRFLALHLPRAPKASAADTAAGSTAVAAADTAHLRFVLCAVPSRALGLPDVLNS